MTSEQLLTSLISRSVILHVVIICIHACCNQELCNTVTVESAIEQVEGL